MNFEEYFTPFSSVSIIEFEQICGIWGHIKHLRWSFSAKIVPLYTSNSLIVCTLKKTWKTEAKSWFPINSKIDNETDTMI